MEAGDRSSESSSAKQKGSAGDGLMGAPPLQHHRLPPPLQTSFRVRVGRLHLRFVRQKALSARHLWPQTGRPWRPWRRPQQGRLRGPLPASARCRSMRGCRHRWPLRGRLRWQPWRASSSHRVPPPFYSVLQVSTASPRPQIAAMNGVTERAFPVGRDTELGLWWAKKAADWPVGCHIIHDTAVHVQPTSLQFPWEPGVAVFAACECFLGVSDAACMPNCGRSVAACTPNCGGSYFGFLSLSVHQDGVLQNLRELHKSSL